ncbi:MAG: hypothetical protein QS98_C0010G0004 [archaeon GW2011_AR3]|nr:MAG: hypothetical protein QS98_C0010G0004 [archaeon GW2011_AR3]MBS3110146.1 hypothetical protein [Candidatus Woesearchaeota archaeon]
MTLDDKLAEPDPENGKITRPLENRLVGGIVRGFLDAAKSTLLYAGSLALAVNFAGIFPPLMSIGMTGGEILRLRKNKEKTTGKKLRSVAYAGLAVGTLARFYFQNFVHSIDVTIIYGKIKRAFRIALLFPMFNLTANFTNYITAKYTPQSFFKRIGQDGRGIFSEYYNDRLKGRYARSLGKAYAFIYPPLATNSVLQIMKPEFLMPFLAGFFRYKVHGESQKKKQPNYDPIPSAIPAYA